ncbi:TPA: hypothetical protein O1Z57_002534 [Staphylococcus aureus]|nr:hypothetical protein [Staphylococcus aureus]
MILTCYNTFNTIEFKSKISGIDEERSK